MLYNIAFAVGGKGMIPFDYPTQGFFRESIIGLAPVFYDIGRRAKVFLRAFDRIRIVFADLEQFRKLQQLCGIRDAPAYTKNSADCVTKRMLVTKNVTNYVIRHECRYRGNDPAR